MNSRVEANLGVYVIMSTSTDRFSLSFFQRKWYNEEIKGKRVMNQSMPDKLILPQNTRLMGVFLGFIGGSLDVFCHIQYHSLVATQTGNILLLISDWHDSHLIYDVWKLPKNVDCFVSHR